MRRTPCPLLAAMLLTLSALPASASAVRGNVSLGRTAKASWLSVLDTVIWFEQVPAKTETHLTRPPFHWFWQRPAPSPLARLEQSGRNFHPHVLALAAGSALEIRNQDNVWHGTFSVSPARPFELGKRAPGRADTVTFANAGVVAIRCDIHPDMSAFVIVTPNHAFTRADLFGNWWLPDVPAGHYVVHAWHPVKGELKRELDVPAHGSVNLALRW